MTAFTLAWRTAARYRARAVLAIAGNAIIGALYIDKLILSRGLLLSVMDMMNSIGYDVRVIGSEGLPMLRMRVPGADALAASIRRLPEVSAVALVRMDDARADAAGKTDTGIRLFATSDVSARGIFTLVRGSGLPASEDDSPDPPVVVARRLAERFGLQPGSTLRIRASVPHSDTVLPPIACRVAGVADFAFDSADEYTVATTIAGFEAMTGTGRRDEADLVLVASSEQSGPAAAAAAISRLRPDLRVYSNDQVIARFNQSGLAYFRQISLLLSVTTGVFAFLLVATLLTVSVNQRLGEIAALRALGVARRRIAATLLWESALLVGTGGVLAIPLGALLATQLDRILRSMPGLPERLHFFAFEPRALGIHAGLLCATAVVAAVYPVWLAINLPIAGTLRREVVS
jgi:ABC-type lipoprotein release transport system permease subunit